MKYIYITQKRRQTQNQQRDSTPLTVASLDQAKQSLYLSLAAASKSALCSRGSLLNVNVGRGLWLFGSRAVQLCMCRFFGGGEGFEGAALRKKERAVSKKSSECRVTMYHSRTSRIPPLRYFLALGVPAFRATATNSAQ